MNNPLGTSPRLSPVHLKWPESKMIHMGRIPCRFFSEVRSGLEYGCFYFQGGSRSDPGGFEGLSDAMGRLLLSGTGEKNRDTLNESIERQGGRILARTMTDILLLSVKAPPGGLEPILDILAELWRHSEFPEKEVERVIIQKREILTSDLNDPGKLANALLFARGFESTPYACPTAGTLSGIQSLSRDLILDSYRNLFTKTVPRMILLSRDPEKWDRVVRNLSESETKSTESSSFENSNGGRVFYFPREGAVQSEIRLIYPLPESEPVYPIQAMNTLFGGRFTSRLNRNLRETLGVTYGVKTTLIRRRSASFIFLSTAVSSDATARSLQEIGREADLLSETSIGEQEIRETADYLIGTMAQAMESPENLLQKLTDALICGENDNYFDTYEERIREVTGQKIRSVAGKFLSMNPGKVTVVVGPPETRETIPGSEVIETLPF